jgi:hypothetical protein
MLLNPCPLQTTQFSISPEHKNFVAEASDLGFKPGQSPYGLLYDDACDAGLTLTNPLTGASTHWMLSQEDTDEGDIVAWIYKPLPETLRKFPKLQHWEVHILND